MSVCADVTSTRTTPRTRSGFDGRRSLHGGNRMPNRILDRADALVYGNRQDDYGDPHAKYEAVGRAWAGMIEAHTGHATHDLPPRLVCGMIAVMKWCRDAEREKDDNLIDAAGYAELAKWVSEDRDK